MKKVRWGVVSTARIATKAVIPAMQAGTKSEIIAIASRSIEAARTVADQFAIPDAYGSYAELLASEDIDAVYIPLPNHMHVPVAIDALQAGKHVLVEKPLGLTSKEGQKLADIAAEYPHLKVMEAFMYRYHAQWQEAVRLVQSGAIGKLRTIQSFFSYANLDPKNVRNTADFGGGGLMDIGCYSVSVSRLLFGAEPKRAFGIMENDPNFGVDCLTSGILDFGSGTSTFTCSTQIAPFQRVNIFGERGHLEIKIPFNPPTDAAVEITITDENGMRCVSVDGQNQYTLQGDLMSEAILNDTPVPTPLSDGVLNMKVLEAIQHSSKSGAWADLP
ncbi:MAG: Gfo/Idh/MocA family protein [Kordiimonas sp.]